MTARLLTFPRRAPFEIEIRREDCAWLVVARSHGWLHGDRHSALQDARWLSRNHRAPVREINNNCSWPARAGAIPTAPASGAPEPSHQNRSTNMRTTIVCSEWRGLHRNTLRGFAKIKIEELHLVVSDVAIHEKNGRRWAQLPAKPQIKDGRVVTDETGKAQYFPILTFEGREIADAFSNAVCAAILKRNPDAFDEDHPERVPAMAGAMDDESPF